MTNPLDVPLWLLPTMAKQWWHCLTHLHRVMTAWKPMDPTDFLCRDCHWNQAPASPRGTP